MFIYDPGTGTKDLQRQLKMTEDDFQKSIVNKSPKWKAYFDFHEGKPKPKNRDEFFQLLIAEEERSITDLAGPGIQIERRQGSFPIFFWLRDDEQAMFVFPTFDPRDPEKTRSVSFFSRDQNFIRVLQFNLAQLANVEEPK